MKINELLGTEFPIIQGGMANIATGAFAAAVSNAGALGLIGSGGMDADTLRKEIQTAKAATDKPFGVNLMLMKPPHRRAGQGGRRGRGQGGHHRRRQPRQVCPRLERGGHQGVPRGGCPPSWPSAWSGTMWTASLPRAPRAAAMWVR